MEKREMQELFKATANIQTPEGMAAYRAFAAALTTPILQKIELESIMRQLFAVERLAAGAQAVYPVNFLQLYTEMYIEKSREFRGSPNVKSRVILSQASLEEGAETIPEGSTLQAIGNGSARQPTWLMR